MYRVPRSASLRRAVCSIVMCVSRIFGPRPHVAPLTSAVQFSSSHVALTRGRLVTAAAHAGPLLGAAKSKGPDVLRQPGRLVRRQVVRRDDLDDVVAPPTTPVNNAAPGVLCV